MSEKCSVFVLLAVQLSSFDPKRNINAVRYGPERRAATQQVYEVTICLCFAFY